jgi:cell division protein FtsQ
MRRLKTAHAGVPSGALSMSGPIRKRAMPAAQRVPARKRPRSALERGLIAAAIGVGAVAVVGGSLYWVIASGWSSYLLGSTGNYLLAASAEAGYRIEKLEVEGRGETDPQAIRLALGALKGDAIFSLDLEEARQRLLTLPWVTSAVVERRLPDTIHVILTEAEPLALWQRQGVFHLVSRTGQVLAIDDVARFGKLPVIVGDGAPQAAGDLFALLATEPDLRARVTAAVLVGQRRWNLRTDNGVDIKLPEIDPIAAWSRFAALERQQNLLEKDVTVIDLRQPDKLVVRQAPLPEEGAEPNGAQPAASPDTAKPGSAKPGASNET